MKNYFIEVTKENGAIVDTRIVAALTPRNAMIIYLNETEINCNETISITECE